jgi:hypothetical protein
MSEPKLASFSVDQQIEAKFGAGKIEAAAGVTRQIFDLIKQEMAQIGTEEGNSAQLTEQVEQYLTMWQDFGNGLFARTASENLRSSETVETAIKGATALLSAEPTVEGKDAASKMTTALKQRHGE